MNFYTRRIFPWWVTRSMSRESLGPYRRETLEHVRGETLEVGFGAGLNLPFYPSHIKRLVAVDHNPGMRDAALPLVEESGIEVEYRVVKGESLPFPDASFDSVVSAWTLCSIVDLDRALREIIRVMKPDGRFFFIEHGLSPDLKVQRWQHRLTPLFRLLADGCHINRDIPALIEGAGLRIAELRRFQIEGSPSFEGYTFQGFATLPEDHGGSG